MQSWQSAPVIGGNQAPASQPTTRPAPPAPAPVNRRVIGGIPAREVRAQNADNRAAEAAERAAAAADRTAATQTFRTLSEDEANQMGLRPGGVYQVNGAGNINVVQAPPTMRDGNSVPGGEAEKAREKISQFTALQRALNTFQDDFAGNTVTGELENTANAYLGLGTPGQSEWWADFRSTDNLIRNSLFGASLTQGEKTAYNQTTIQPGMTPAKVRENLERRAEIVRKVLAREKEFYLANGYKPEAVEALFAVDGLEPRAPDGGPKTTERPYTIVSEAESAAIFGEPMYDQEGNPVGNDYDGEGLYDKDGKRVSSNIRITDDSPMQNGYGSSERGAFLVLEDGSVLTGYDDEGAPVYRPYQEGMAADPQALQMRRQMGFDVSDNRAATISARANSLGLSDEFAGIGGALGAALRGEDIGVGFQAGQQGELRRYDQAREQYGAGPTLALEVLSGAAGGRAVTGVSAGLNAARRVAAGGGNVSRQTIQRSLTQRAGATGAALGGVSGAANGETLQERGVNALAGAALGGSLGAGGQAAGNALSNAARRPASVTSGAATMAAADRLGIEPIPAVTGGTTARIATSGAKQGFISARPIDAAIDKMSQQAGAARTRASNAAGTALEGEDAGNIVRRGAEIYSSRTSAIGGKLYDRADRLAQGAKVPLPRAVQALDDEIASLSQSPTAASSALLKDLRTLRDQVANGDFSIKGIRAMRTDLREQIVARGLRSSPSDVIYGRVLKAAEDDAIEGLRARGLDNAAGAMQTARDFWRKRVETIDEVLDPLLGKNSPRSGEQILAAFERMAKPDSGNAVNLRRLLEAMPKGEASAVRASVINRLGRPTAGSGQIDREGFSFDTFLTNYNNMTPRARAILFPPGSRALLDDLATVSSGVKQAGSSANRSNTAGAVTVQAALSGAGYWALEPLQLGGGLLAQYGVGLLLASPKFARVLAGAPRQSTPQARKALDARLTSLARAEPTLANEIGMYQRALAANDNKMVGRVAAEDENQQPR